MDDSAVELGSTPDSHLTFGRFGVWPTVAGLLAVVVIGLSMPIPFTGRAAVALGDLAHAPLFGSLAFFAMHVWQRLRPLPFGRKLLLRALGVGLSVALFGGSMELLQHVVGRSATIHDAVANSLGILTAMLLYIAQRLGQIRRLAASRTLVAVGLVVFAYAWSGPFAVLNDVWAVDRDFPLLSSAESHAELERWHFRECRGKRVQEDATHGRYALEIEYAATPYPGATLVEVHRDWSRFNTLELDVAVDAAHPDPVRFIIKVIDATFEDTQDYEDMFVREWTLQPGSPERILISRDEILAGPPNRETVIAAIRYIDFIVADSKVPTTLRIDDLRVTLDEAEE